MARGRAGLTRYFVADEVAKECESIVECRANILSMCGLEANRGIDTARFAIDVCRYEVICNISGLLNWIEVHDTLVFFLEKAQRITLNSQMRTTYPRKETTNKVYRQLSHTERVL